MSTQAHSLVASPSGSISDMKDTAPELLTIPDDGFCDEVSNELVNVAEQDLLKAALEQFPPTTDDLNKYVENTRLGKSELKADLEAALAKYTQAAMVGVEVRSMRLTSYNPFGRSSVFLQPLVDIGILGSPNFRISQTPKI